MRNRTFILNEGDIYSSRSYGDFRIIKYNTSADVDIEFIATGNRKKTQATQIKLGTVKDELYPKLFGVGYIGVGQYKASANGANTRAYKVWRQMLTRCYCAKYQDLYPTYKGCSVCEEWLNFQVFADWFHESYVDGHHLDKDIKIKGNRIYSPKACSFVTPQQNSIEARAKHHKMISPDGEVVQIYNMRKFCLENGLGQSNMCSVHSGDRKSHKGWRKA